LQAVRKDVHPSEDLLQGLLCPDRRLEGCPRGLRVSLLLHGSEGQRRCRIHYGCPSKVRRVRGRDPRKAQTCLKGNSEDRDEAQPRVQAKRFEEGRSLRHFSLRKTAFSSLARLNYASRALKIRCGVLRGGLRALSLSSFFFLVLLIQARVCGDSNSF